MNSGSFETCSTFTSQAVEIKLGSWVGRINAGDWREVLKSCYKSVLIGADRTRWMFPSYQRSVLQSSDTKLPPSFSLHILNFFPLLKSPPPPSSPAFVSFSSSPLPDPARGERTVPIQGSGGGKLAFRSPSSMALYARTPGPSTWQCDNVAGLFKRDPVFVKCFSPWRATTGQGQEPWTVLMKEEGQLWSRNVKGMGFFD